MADNPDLFSFIGDWSAAADQLLSSKRAQRLQMQFSAGEREILRLMLHGSIRPPEGVDQSLLVEAETFSQRAMEECENRLRAVYTGPLIGNEFLRRLTDMKALVEQLIPEVVNLRDFNIAVQGEFQEDEDVRITRDFPSGIFTTMDEFHTSEAGTDRIDVAPLTVPVPTLPAPKTYPEQYGPRTRSQSGLRAMLPENVQQDCSTSDEKRSVNCTDIVFDESTLADKDEPQ